MYIYFDSDETNFNISLISPFHTHLLLLIRVVRFEKKKKKTFVHT